ncbi:unnamed protein product, partial [Owenia fusiformis]
MKISLFKRTSTMFWILTAVLLQAGVVTSEIPGDELWSCDFESNIYCDAVRISEFDPRPPEYMWMRKQGATPSGNTGPQGDNTPGLNGEGHYVYTEASPPREPDDETDFTTPNVKTNVFKKSLTFSYNMYGKSIGYLEVAIRNSTHGENLIYRLAGDQGKEWKSKQLELPIGEFIVVFKSVRGSGWDADIALDDILITVADDVVSDIDPCLSAPCQNGGFCEWNLGDSSYICLCTDKRYSGRLCELDAGAENGACNSNPCQNGGQCIQPNKDDVNVHQCFCLPGYGGPFCEKPPVVDGSVTTSDATSPPSSTATTPPSTTTRPPSTTITPKSTTTTPPSTTTTPTSATSTRSRNVKTTVVADIEQTTKGANISSERSKVYPAPGLGEAPILMHGVYWVHKQQEYLPSRNTDITPGLTKEECLNRCINMTQFLCKSVDYVTSNQECILSNSNRQNASTVSSENMEYYERVELAVNHSVSTEKPKDVSEPTTAVIGQTTKGNQASTSLPGVYPTPGLGETPTMRQGVYWVHKQGEY